MDHLALLEFENFQSLKKAELKLDPGLNVIVGPSNLGKSAAVRAIKALVKNAPAPGLIRTGEKEMTVTALFSDADYIDLHKTKTKSSFYVNGEEFAKAGAYSVPEAVSTIWNIPDPDLTFASQHDSPFLLSEPASQVAHVLGELTNASMLMEAVQRANKLRTQALTDEKARVREAEEARDELLSHAGLTARTKLIEAAREAYRAASEAVQRWQDLVSLKETFTIIQAELDKLEIFNTKTDLADVRLEKAEKAAAELAALQQLQAQHKALSLELVSAINTKEFSESNIDRLHEQLEELMQDGCPLCERPF